MGRVQGVALVRWARSGLAFQLGAEPGGFFLLTPMVLLEELWRAYDNYPPQHFITLNDLIRPNAASRTPSMNWDEVRQIDRKHNNGMTHWSGWSVDWKWIIEQLNNIHLRSSCFHSMLIALIKSLPWAHWWSPGWPPGCATRSSRRSHLCGLV